MWTTSEPLDPFFRIVEEGLSGLADGDNFFDLLADGDLATQMEQEPSGGSARDVESRSIPGILPMELVGLEPTTFALPARRSPS